MKRPRNNASETPSDADGPLSGPREPKLTGEVTDSRSGGGSRPETLDTLTTRMPSEMVRIDQTDSGSNLKRFPWARQGNKPQQE